MLGVAMVRLRVILPAAGVAAGLVLGCGGSDGGSAARATPTARHAGARRADRDRDAGRRRAQGRAARADRHASTRPVFVTAPRGDRRVQFVVEQGGRIMVVRDGRKLATPFLDISAQVTSGGEQGLLSMAFAPDYASSGRFYVYFTDDDGDQRVVEYRRASADRADAGSARLVLDDGRQRAQPQRRAAAVRPRRAPLHRHGRRRRRRRPPRRARQRAEPRLAARQDPADRPAARPAAAPTRCPRSNPFVGRSGARGEIYAYGLRNPWRFSFDRRTGDLSIGDVGQGEVEEIDFVRSGRGKNFGWRPFEGRRRYTPGESAPGHVRPGASSASTADGNCSITGGVVVRDRAVPALYGRYVFGDFCRGRIESARLRPGRRDAAAHDAAERPEPLLVRRGRPRPRLRDLARRPGLPDRGPR